MNDKLELTKTQEVLIDMLTENTGRHFLDSGGAYGRNWEKNQGRQFVNESEATAEFSIYSENELDILISVNVFHWLDSRLNYEPYLDKLYQKFSDAYYRENEYQFSWLDCTAEFIKYLDESPRWEVSYGIYPGESDSPITINTYNHESVLSQIIQFSWVYIEVNWNCEYYNSEDFESPGEGIVFLQIHGGCDARGGYTGVRVFSESGHSELAMFEDSQVTLGCTECNAYWDSYTAGYSFERSDYNYPNESIQLEDIKVRELTENEQLTPSFSKWFNALKNRWNAQETTLIIEDGREDSPRCPACGKGNIIAYTL